MSRDDLDLLLLSDEVSSDFSGNWTNPRGHYLRQLFGHAYGRVELTQAQKRTIESAYPGSDYLYDRPDGGVGLSFPHRPSLALADLATVARDAGYRVRIVDNFVRWPSRLEQLRRICDASPPRLIGLSTTFIFAPQIVEDIVGVLRELAPEAKIALGGPTARRIPALHACADYAVFGSGEESLIGLLQGIRGERPIESVPRIAYRTEAGIGYGPDGAEAALVGRVGEPYRALRGETIPAADWSLYRRSPQQVYPIEFSRGCKYNCYYCAYDRGKNIRGIADIRRELARNAEFGITRYRFSDSNFTDGPPSRPSYPHEVCRAIIDLGLKLEWSCYARADDVDEELAELMRRAGCFAVFFGIESGDDGVLKLMRKGHDSADAARGIRIVQEAGIRAHANFVVGYPGDSRAANERTLEFIQRSRPDMVIMGQFWAEEKTPVMGPRMKALRLVGEGMNWRHATMCSDEAAELAQSNFKRLLGAGITLGSEFEVSAFMSFGLSLDEALQHVHDLNTLQPESAAGERECEAAAERIRELMMHRFPKAIAEDWRVMQIE